jgi:DNA-directed RNA polymerase subunit M/transcription elongation factor TFIIS
MSLLENAIASLHLALEDYASPQDTRLLSAVRNLHAGILLLYKEKLRLLSPPGTDDVLVKAKSKFQKGPTGVVTSVGIGKKTVDVFQIKERFDALGVQTDWKRFDKVSALRNEIEHYFTTANRGAMEVAISDTFLIIRDFIHTELAADPKVLLGDEAWAKLLSVSEVVEKERELCQKALVAIDWQSDGLADAVLELRCAECGSSLLFPLTATKETDLQCRSCGEEEAFSDYAERAVSDYFASDNHYAMTDGGDPATITCPHCGDEGYIVAENCCVLCGESCETTCERCGSSIPVEELNDGSFCGYCDHVMSKDD